jgi:NAD-dependent deacetylase
VAATAYGQVLFCESAGCGVGLFLGFAVLAPTAACMGALGAMIATLVARALGAPVVEWQRGVYSYSAALTGLYLGSLFEPTPAAWGALIGAAALSVPCTSLAHRALTPSEIPALALPALGLSWLAGVGLAPATGHVEVHTTARLVGWAIVAIALLRYSHLVALAGATGAAVGAGAGIVLAGRVEPALLANSVPTAIALGAVFLPLSAASLASAVVGATAAAVLSWEAMAVAEPWGLSPLVAPFNVVTVLALVAARSHRVRAWLPGWPAPLPLHAIGHPDQIREAWRARRRLHALVRHASRLCVLTGAGVSRESGLPDFRSPGGLWSRSARITLDDFVGSPVVRAAYWRDEDHFFELVGRARPSSVHRALAALHRGGRLAAVVTQNVDGLHQAAGVPPDAVIELHGSIHRARCVDCGHTVPRESLSPRIEAGATSLFCDKCQGLLKGGSVMFGEEVAADRLDEALRALLASDLLLVLGTSLEVAPASNLLDWARDAGIPIAIVNATPTPYDGLARVKVAADVGTIALEMAHGAAATTRNTRERER